MKPKIFNRVRNAVLAFSESQGKNNNGVSNDAVDFLRYGPRNRPMLQDWSQVEMSDRDMYTGYSYAAIKKRANRSAALGKRFLYTEASPSVMNEAKKKGRELEHPYLELIRKSKDFSQRKFWHDISTYLDLEGVYYLMAVRAVKTNVKGEVKVGHVQRFVMLNPYNVHRVIRESDGTIGGYVESKNGTYREIPKEMIIEIRLLNPFDNDKAFSMTDAAKESQFTMKQAGDYTRHSIRGNINAPGAITTEVQLEDHIFDNFVSRVQNHTKGEPLYGNGSGAIHWESMQIDLDKASLDKINEIHRSTLFAVSGVSKTAMGIEESGTGREVSKTQRDDFTENAVMPQIEDIIDALNLDYRQWYSEWEQNEYEILLDNPLESDREAELKDIEIRENELGLRESLIGMGYEHDIAAKYAHGLISLEELGEPTLEEEISDKDAERIASEAEEIDQSSTTEDPSDGASQDIVNRVTTKNKFVRKEVNEKKIEEARKRLKAKSEKKKAAKESEKQSEEVIDQEEQKKKADKKENSIEEKAVNQVAARDIPDLYEDIEIDPRAVSDDDYRGCIMMNTEKIPVTQYIKDGEKDLVHETDRHDHAMGAVSEVKPHTTLLYGLLNNGNIWKDKVDQVLEGWSMPQVKIEEVSYFDLPDAYAVIAHLEKTPEIMEGHDRLTLLPHVNTFSEYKPHITLAYINKDADVEEWVRVLGKKYDGQIVATTALNYGDPPEDESDDDDDDEEIEENSVKAVENKSSEVTQDLKVSKSSPETSFKATHSHDHHDHEFVPNSSLQKVLNELDPLMQDQVVLQEADLERAVAQVESDVAQAVIQALREGDVDEAQELLTEAQEEGFIAQLALIIAAYYTVLFPIYAAQLLAYRLAEFGIQGIFAMTDEVKLYINQAARQAAESHIHTIISDFQKTVIESVDEATQEELLRLVQERVSARDPEYTKLLPENPNPEDVVKAVKSGKFDNHPAFKLARDMVRQGAGLNEIERAILDRYTRMSETRAKTIARHEASRVFNMSQYQADLQFLTESNNLSNAYKRLRSRTGDPCAVCNLLIEKTRRDPIPFTKNFADLGEELTATYRKENGKMAVLKVPVNYEAIKAGNVHVNCNCEYELVIKQEDGTILNDLSELKIGKTAIIDNKE